MIYLSLINSLMISNTWKILSFCCFIINLVCRLLFESPKTLIYNLNLIIYILKIFNLSIWEIQTNEMEHLSSNYIWICGSLILNKKILFLSIYPGTNTVLLLRFIVNQHSFRSSYQYMFLIVFDIVSSFNSVEWSNDTSL